MATLQTRVTNILLTPKTEWPVIAAEPANEGKLFREYIIPLSAIPAIAGFIGMTFVGVFGYRLSMAAGLKRMVVMYLLGLAGVYVCAMVIEWLAPKFKSSGSRVDALKLVAYSSTAAWVVGVIQAVPALAILGILALYGVYLFYLGLPVLMKTPTDQVVPYMLVSFVVIVVAYLVMMAIAGVIAGGPTLHI